MTHFVGSSATDQLIPPWISKGCQTWGFVIAVGEANVRDYLKIYFNGDYPDRSPYVYAPIPGPQFGLVIYAHHPDVCSISKDAPKDRLSFSEVLWTFPVRRTDAGGNEKTVWVQPFAFCDNASVMFASREIWGADVVYGQITPPKPPAPRQSLHVDVAIEGIRKFSPYSMSQLLGCMHIHKARGHVVKLEDFLLRRPNLRTFAELVAQFHGGPAGDPELNNIKQIRDAYELRQAVYRAVVASSASHTLLGEPTYYLTRGLEVSVMWSDSTAEMATSLLGIKRPRKEHDPPLAHTGESPPDPTPTTPPGKAPARPDWSLPRTDLDVQLAFSFASDVKFQVKKTLFTYGAGDPAALRPTSARKS
jgi:hypothetical protein